MVKKIKFVKMHGLGNDFVIINSIDLPSKNDLFSLAQDIANRHTGIGCDQLIVYNKHLNFYEMLIYNIDGSSAKLCGNASRCLAKLIHLHSGQKSIVIKVGNKQLSCQIITDNEVSVNMGEVSFEENWMPQAEKIWQFANRYMIDLKEAICVDVGNPHIIIFSKLSSQDKKIIGEKLQDKELFTDGINVNFVDIRDNNIYLSVWERGVGLTFACGSGACASFAASLKLGFVHSPSQVIFEYGALKMSKQNSDIVMTGPAALVADGEFYYD